MDYGFYVLQFIYLIVLEMMKTVIIFKSTKKIENAAFNISSCQNVVVDHKPQIK